MPIEDMLPAESGSYKYVIIEHEGQYHLATGSTNTGHPLIAQAFFKELGVIGNPIAIGLGFRELGGKGGGTLDWDKEGNHVVYHGGSMFRTPSKEDIDNLMNGSEITYEAPLDEPPVIPGVPSDRYGRPFQIF
ncbi:MAG: hypothetical protein ABIH34_00850 [Nanoarchaeota archaeon]